jgi:hypothetical protein
MAEAPVTNKKVKIANKVSNRKAEEVNPLWAMGMFAPVAIYRVPSFARIIAAQGMHSKIGLAEALLCCPLGGNQISSRRIIRFYNAGDVSLNNLLKPKPTGYPFHA